VADPRALDRRARDFRIASLVVAVVSLVFLLWLLLSIGGTHTTDAVDDLGELVAALAAAAACAIAAHHLTSGRSAWNLLGLSALAWAAGEGAWTYYDLIRGIQVPFPSLADIGFLAAVPLAVAGLLLFPSSPRRAADRVQGILDGCIIAGSILFASWVTVLEPLYNKHQGGFFDQALSLAYPASDVVMVALVFILFSRAGQKGRASLGLVMAGLIAFAVADSAFSYMTEVHNYGTGTFLDTGWVAGYLLIGLGALRAAHSPSTAQAEPRVTTLSLVAPYVPVLVVLAVTAVELLLGHHVGNVGWTMVFALALLVLGRQLLSLWDHRVRDSNDARSEGPDDFSSSAPDVRPALTGH